AVKNDAQDFVLYAAYFRIKDVTKGASDLGIEVVGGQYFSTFYGMEQYYQPFKFIDKPLDFRLFPNNITPL
ncbi:MAG: hypothetical protein NTY22_02425, partial [Proteobacteria bacterium]|nr:hypothetical protein [Pseudomonadota bacterium]